MGSRETARLGRGRRPAMSVLELRAVPDVYGEGTAEVHALRDGGLSVEAGSMGRVREPDSLGPIITDHRPQPGRAGQEGVADRPPAIGTACARAADAGLASTPGKLRWACSARVFGGCTFPDQSRSAWRENVTVGWNLPREW
jgi:hypothetical protein